MRMAIGESREVTLKLYWEEPDASYLDLGVDSGCYGMLSKGIQQTEMLTSVQKRQVRSRLESKRPRRSQE